MGGHYRRGPKRFGVLCIQVDCPAEGRGRGRKVFALNGRRSVRRACNAGRLLGQHRGCQNGESRNQRHQGANHHVTSFRREIVNAISPHECMSTNGAARSAKKLIWKKSPRYAGFYVDQNEKVLRRNDCQVSVSCTGGQPRIPSLEYLLVALTARSLCCRDRGRNLRHFGSAPVSTSVRTVSSRKNVLPRFLLLRESQAQPLLVVFEDHAR